MRRLHKIIACSGVALAAVAGLFIGTGYIGGASFIDYPAKVAHPTTAAVFLSGDMGFMGMGGDLVRRINADGTPVVAINSLAYFRSLRTPAEVETLIETGVRRALAMDGGAPVTLIGQSFGADMLHVGLARLPSDLRAKVHAVALVVPTDTVHFRASPSEIFSNQGLDNDAFPTASRLTWVRTVCIYGESETDSLCPHLKQRNVVPMPLPGGHFLEFKTDLVHGLLKQAIGGGQRA